MTVQSPPQKRRSRSSLLILLALTGTLLIVFLASIGLVVYLVSGTGAGDVADGSFLEIELGGEITDAPAQGGFYLDPEDVPPVLTDITGAIRAASEDERITGLYLRVEEPAVGWAGTQELRDAIATFRAAGKPCVAYAESYTTTSYYLASACDRVVLAPTGIGLVTGLSVSQTYYAGAFEKWNVQADLLHVGDFKSAVEPYTRKEPSEPASLAMNELLDSLWARWVAGVAESRGRSTEEVQAWVDHPSLSARGMLESGMVDALAFPDQVRGRATTAADEAWIASLTEPVTEKDEEIDEHFTDLGDYLQQMEDGSVFGSEAKIAVVYAEGPIVSGEAEGGLFGSATIADRTVRGWLDTIREDEDIDAVVLRVNSPGGSGLASDMIWRDLQRLKETGKPVVVSMGNYAASGGYYIATAGDHIVAEPSTLTGSIGVFGGKIAIGGAYEWFGLSEHTYKRGANADLLSPSAPFSEEGRAVYQTFLDEFYEVFLERVATARELERDQVHEVAQGRVWTGEQALDRKLVDELGGLDVAIAKAAELAELGEDYSIERWPKSRTFMELVLEDLEGASAPELALPASADLPLVDQRVLSDLLTLEEVLGDGVAALVPGNLRIE